MWADQSEQTGYSGGGALKIQELKRRVSDIIRKLLCVLGTKAWMDHGFHCEGQSEFQRQSKGCDFVHISWVPRLSASGSLSKINRTTSFQHSTEDQQSPSNASCCCVFFKEKLLQMCFYLGLHRPFSHWKIKDSWMQFSCFGFGAHCHTVRAYWDTWTEQRQSKRICTAPFNNKYTQRASCDGIKKKTRRQYNKRHLKKDLKRVK